MARRGRADSAGSWHHVINRGIARRPMFEASEDIRYFLSRLAREFRRGRLELHAWCVLTTHFHLLVRSPAGELSEAMRRAENEYSRYFNRRHLRDGTLIRGRFFSRPASSLQYRRILVRYIDANSVDAGLADRGWEYPWSSAWHYVRDTGPRWMTRTWIEEEVAQRACRDAYDPADYASVFGKIPTPGAKHVVEQRMRRAPAPDSLDDLIGAAPLRVREWMARKTELADGTELGLPLCDAESISGAIDMLRTMEGDWVLRPHGRGRDGWGILRIALLRIFGGLTWDQLASAIGSRRTTCCQIFGEHRDLLRDEPAYVDRFARATSSAMQRTFDLAPSLPQVASGSVA